MNGQIMYEKTDRKSIKVIVSEGIIKVKLPLNFNLQDTNLEEVMAGIKDKIDNLDLRGLTHRGVLKQFNVSSSLKYAKQFVIQPRKDSNPFVIEHDLVLNKECVKLLKLLEKDNLTKKQKYIADTTNIFTDLYQRVIGEVGQAYEKQCALWKS